jgi:hypothetical protein
MGQLSDALEVAARQLEARLASHRELLRDREIRGTLPQSWRFETESESAVLRLERSGRVTVAADVIEPPAVIVRWTQALLVDALLHGRPNEAPRPEPPPTVLFPQDAGRKAFSRLGTSLGL